VLAIDLPGYGRSDPPKDMTMSKRDLATVVHEAATALGVTSYALVGHDRGGRVAYRAALDRPWAIRGVAVLDIIPTLEVWERADDQFALSFWPFSLFAQPAPLPERLIVGDPAAIVDDALDRWGSAPAAFPDEVRASYVTALRDPDHAHAICEEYRAAASVDPEHDRRDRESGRRISAPMLCLWSSNGALGTWYAEAGGPLGIWANWAENLRGQAVDAGHFFPEEIPQKTAVLVASFLTDL
jgi:haloacetate dehalogenase